MFNKIMFKICLPLTMAFLAMNVGMSSGSYRPNPIDGISGFLLKISPQEEEETDCSYAHVFVKGVPYMIVLDGPEENLKIESPKAAVTRLKDEDVLTIRNIVGKFSPSEKELILLGPVMQCVETAKGNNDISQQVLPLNITSKANVVDVFNLAGFCVKGTYAPENVEPAQWFLTCRATSLTMIPFWLKQLAKCYKDGVGTTPNVIYADAINFVASRISTTGLERKLSTEQQLMQFANGRGSAFDLKNFYEREVHSINKDSLRLVLDALLSHRNNKEIAQILFTDFQSQLNQEQLAGTLIAMKDPHYAYNMVQLGLAFRQKAIDSEKSEANSLLNYAYKLIASAVHLKYEAAIPLLLPTALCRRDILDDSLLANVRVTLGSISDHPCSVIQRLFYKLYFGVGPELDQLCCLATLQSAPEGNLVQSYCNMLNNPGFVIEASRLYELAQDEKKEKALWQQTPNAEILCEFFAQMGFTVNEKIPNSLSEYGFAFNPAAQTGQEDTPQFVIAPGV